MDWMDGWLSYTAVTPRASLQSDANKKERRFERRAGVKYRPIQLIIVEDFAKLTQAAERLRVGRDKDEI